MSQRLSGRRSNQVASIKRLSIVSPTESQVESLRSMVESSLFKPKVDPSQRSRIIKLSSSCQRLSQIVMVEGRVMSARIESQHESTYAKVDLSWLNRRLIKSTRWTNKMDVYLRVCWASPWTMNQIETSKRND